MRKQLQIAAENIAARKKFDWYTDWLRVETLLKECGELQDAKKKEELKVKDEELKQLLLRVNSAAVAFRNENIEILKLLKFCGRIAGITKQTFDKLYQPDVNPELLTSLRTLGELIKLALHDE